MKDIWVQLEFPSAPPHSATFSICSASLSLCMHVEHFTNRTLFHKTTKDHQKDIVNFRKPWQRNGGRMEEKSKNELTAFVCSTRKQSSAKVCRHTAASNESKIMISKLLKDLWFRKAVNCPAAESKSVTARNASQDYVKQLQSNMAQIVHVSMAVAN